jgi:hypothetical protein
MNRRSSIRKKLVVVVMATTLAALLVSVGLIIAYDLRNYQRSLVNDLSTQAELVGHMTSAALAFDDARLARETMAGRWCCSARSSKTARRSAPCGCAPRTGCWRARSTTSPSPLA